MKYAPGPVRHLISPAPTCLGSRSDMTLVATLIANPASPALDDGAIERVQSALSARQLPDWLAPANPFDFWIGIDVRGAREAHEIGLAAVFADPNVDVVLCTLLAPGNADFAEFGDLMRRLRRSYDKPVALVIYGGEAEQRWIADLEGANIPVFKTTRAAVRALALLAQATM